MPIVIAMTGAAGHGKDTVAHHLVKRYKFTRTGFSWPLKAMLCKQFGWNFDRLNDDLAYKEEQAPGLPTGWTRRRVMQWIGTEGFRHIDPEHWVKKTIERVDLLVHGGCSVVVADVRFPNEVDALRGRFGAHVIKVVCPDHPTTRSVEAGTHVSETAMASIAPDVVFTVMYGDLDGLRALAGTEIEGLAREGRFGKSPA